MKSVIRCFGVVCILASVSFAGFDFRITDTYENGTVDLDDNSLLVLGAGAYAIEARNLSYIEIRDTALPLQIDVGGIWVMDLNDNSSVMHIGGATMGITLSDNATAILEGGRVDYISSYQYILQPNQEVLRHIEIVCELESVNHDISTNILTGNWLDGSGFKIQLVDVDNYDHVIDNIFFTPEPVSIALFGLGAILLRKRKRV